MVFAGRLSTEKGVESLIRACLLWGPHAPALRVLGDGPLASSLCTLATTAHQVPIRFLGQVSQPEAARQISGARLVVVPSICFDGFPMVTREAYAYGTPVAAARIGPVPSIVRTHEQGLLFEPGSAKSIVREIQPAWRSDYLEGLSAGARRAFETQNTEAANYLELTRIYDHARGLVRTVGGV